MQISTKDCTKMAHRQSWFFSSMPNIAAWHFLDHHLSHTKHYVFFVRVISPSLACSSSPCITLKICMGHMTYGQPHLPSCGWHISTSGCCHHSTYDLPSFTDYKTSATPITYDQPSLTIEIRYGSDECWARVQLLLTTIITPKASLLLSLMTNHHWPS